MAKDSGVSAASAAAAKKASKAERATTKEDQSRARMKQYAIMAVVLGCTLPLLVPLFSGVSTAMHPASYVELSSPTQQQLHQVFFSGQPHIVFCTNKTGGDIHRLVGRVSDTAIELAAATTTKEAMMAATAAKAAAKKTGKGKDAASPKSDDPLLLSYPELSPLAKSRLNREGIVSSPLGLVRVVTLDCEAPLPSGHNVLTRFKLGSLPPHVFQASTAGGGPGSSAGGSEPIPPAFYVGGGGVSSKATWVPAELFREGGDIAQALMQHLDGRLAPRTVSISSDKSLTKDCTALKHCVAILHAGSASLSKRPMTSSIRAIHQHMPQLKVVTIDVLKHTLAPLQESLGEASTADQQWPRLVYFRRTISSAAEGSTSSLLFKNYEGGEGRFLPTAILTFLKDLSDAPTFVADSGVAMPGSNTGAASMTELETAPYLNNGANNFAKRAAPRTREELDAARAERAAARSKSAEREREVKRREQMEAERAESANFVQEVEDSEGGIEQPDEADEDEAVNLDDTEQF